MNVFEGEEKSGDAGQPAVIEGNFKRGTGSGPYGINEFSCGPFTFNPFVSVAAAVTLWGFIIFTISNENSSMILNEWKTWVGFITLAKE